MRGSVFWQGRSKGGITHDSRTDELTKFLGLPRISIDEFDNFISVQELYDYCDFSEFRHRYKSLCDNYLAYLEENGIEYNK